MQKNNLFTQVQVQKVPSSTFDLSHTATLTTQQGRLTPCYLEECLPGDRFNGAVKALVRFAPLAAPVMSRFKVYFHYWFVPHRLSWASYKDFFYQGIQDDIPAFPTLEGFVPTESSLADYLGLPIGHNMAEISALPFAAYQRIYNDKYRDQNLIQPIEGIDLTDGDNSAHLTELTTLRQRAWGHDYFTSCLPTAQKGDPVTLPVGVEAFGDTRLEYTGAATYTPIHFDTNVRAATAGHTLDQSPANVALNNVPGTTFPLTINADIGTVTPDIRQENIQIDNSGSMIAKTSELDPVFNETTVNDFRTAMAVQEWLELNNRGGTRYPEGNNAHFGVRDPDSRIQMPEYIGGSVSNVVVSEVLQTSTSTDSDTPLGTFGGHAYSMADGQQFNYECLEHGYVMCIMSILPETAYQQGIQRHWRKFAPTDYGDPKFANLGEQAVKNGEIYYNHSPQDDEVFGYIPRFSEYKFHPSTTAGAFRTSLAFWTSTRIFASRPGLNGNFVSSDPTQRIFAVEDDSDKLWCQIYHELHVNRKLPFFGTPYIK